MPQLTVNNNTYDYPESGSAPGWGGEATAWAEAVTDVLNLLIAPGDILRTTFTIQNNVSVAAGVQGLIFDPAIVRAANVTYTIRRNSLVESGTIYLAYNPDAPATQKWNMNVQNMSPVGVYFTILDNGQVQYTSTNDTDGGLMTFTARTLST